MTFDRVMFSAYFIKQCPQKSYTDPFGDAPPFLKLFATPARGCSFVTVLIERCGDDVLCVCIFCLDLILFELSLLKYVCVYSHIHMSDSN